MVKMVKIRGGEGEDKLQWRCGRSALKDKREGESQVEGIKWRTRTAKVYEGNAQVVELLMFGQRMF